MPGEALIALIILFIGGVGELVERLPRWYEKTMSARAVKEVELKALEERKKKLVLEIIELQKEKLSLFLRGQTEKENSTIVLGRRENESITS